MKAGDRNTSFFHACASARRRRNYVGSIMDEHGNLWESSREVGEAFVNYFTNLFSKGPVGDYSPRLQPMLRSVTDGMNLELAKPFTAEEIEVALFQMAPLKAPDRMD